MSECLGQGHKGTLTSLNALSSDGLSRWLLNKSMGQQPSDLFGRSDHFSHGIGVEKRNLGRHDAGEIAKIERSLKSKIAKLEQISRSALNSDSERRVPGSSVDFASNHRNDSGGSGSGGGGGGDGGSGGGGRGGGGGGYGAFRRDSATSGSCSRRESARNRLSEGGSGSGDGGGEGGECGEGEEDEHYSERSISFKRPKEASFLESSCL